MPAKVILATTARDALDNAPSRM